MSASASVCLNCTAGFSTNSLSGTTVCTQCTSGTYSISNAASVCSTCASGLTSDAGATFCYASYTTGSLTPLESPYLGYHEWYHGAVAFGSTIYLPRGNQIYVDTWIPNVNAWSPNVVTLSIARWSATLISTSSIFILAGGCMYNAVIDNFASADIYSSLTGSVSFNPSFLSIARSDCRATIVLDSIMFAGGLNVQNQIYYNTVDIYNLTTGLISSTSLSQARSNIAAVTVANKAIFGVGSTSQQSTSNVFDIYDPSTSTWTTFASSQVRSNASGISIDKYAIFAGGLSIGNNIIAVTSLVDIYDSSTGSWTTSSMIKGTSRAATGVIGSKAIFVGGFTNILNPFLYSNQIQMFDITSMSWSLVSSTLIDSSYAISSVVIGSTLYLNGGVDVSARYSYNMSYAFSLGACSSGYVLSSGSCKACQAGI